jgi:hypothetical protein
MGLLLYILGTNRGRSKAELDGGTDGALCGIKVPAIPRLADRCPRLRYRTD